MSRSLELRKMAVLVIVAGMLVMVAGVGVRWAHAFGPGGHGGYGGGFGGLKLLMQLDLTDAQKARILAMLPRYRAEKDARQEELYAMRKRVQALMEADTYNEDEVRQAFREMAPLMEDMAVGRAQFMFDIKSVLTPEQIAFIKDKHANQQRRRGEHRKIRESMLDTWLQTPAGSEPAR
ncbi:MAG: Spy/CpxP family protein refolding chaperone [Desulfosarcina sp.]|nr:Spy/CpxP family protein refolding chaperone [Desulfobacterales bacterium]